MYLDHIEDRVDATRAYDRHLVEHLHEAADRATGKLADLLRDAAVALDDYQAGWTLATPDPDTGYVLVPAAMLERLQVRLQADPAAAPALTTETEAA